MTLPPTLKLLLNKTGGAVFAMSDSLGWRFFDIEKGYFSFGNSVSEYKDVEVFYLRQNTAPEWKLYFYEDGDILIKGQWRTDYMNINKGHSRYYPLSSMCICPDSFFVILHHENLRQVIVPENSEEERVYFGPGG